MHLFPGLDQLNGIDPLVAARTPDVVEMVVYACPSSAARLVGHGNSDQVARVVVGPKECYGVGDVQAGRVVIANFLHEID